MLITELKPKDSILPLLKGKTIVIICEGCREVHFPEKEVNELRKELADSVSATVITDYICNSDNLILQLRKHMDKVNEADTILVVSCGVGVQTVAQNFEDKKIVAACDTYPLPGFQGVTPLEYDCEQCGDCHLNDTGGICPITACSKRLVNGQCGGSKNGKCEVDNEMECGWERIYRRLERLGRLNKLKYDVKVRNYATESIIEGQTEK